MRRNILLAMAVAGGLIAQQPDNTGVNKRDRDKDSVTAQDQGESKEDREMVAQIRKEVVNTKSFSTYAKNVKIAVINGKVTLKGPVRTEEEKAAIEAIAKKIAGDANVTNSIEIAKAN